MKPSLRTTPANGHDLAVETGLVPFDISGSGEAKSLGCRVHSGCCRLMALRQRALPVIGDGTVMPIVHPFPA